MIKGLYETHLFVEDLERSANFYENVLGLIPCGYNDERRIAFFWIGEPKGAMLGLWEKPKDQIDIRHFAFRCEVEYVVHRSVAYLKSRDLEPYNFLKDGKEKPMVFAWMPAVAIYFKDPDGHELEFIAILAGDSRPELGIVSYEDWEKITTK
jgi:lactoylglutathione lyase